MNENSIMENVKTAAKQAKEIEDQAKAEPDSGTYTHIFAKPFAFEGRTFERMNFDWAGLTGKDSAAVKRELQRRGVFAVMDAFSDDYLAAMAARACTDRDDGGRRMVSGQTIEALPVRDYRNICDKLRSFLLRAESGPMTEDSGSENNARHSPD